MPLSWDTYVAGSDIGIVEIGGICHASIYDADLMKIVSALDSMPWTMGLNGDTAPKALLPR